MEKGPAISNTLCPTKVFAHKAPDMSSQQVEHSFNSTTLCRSSPRGWSFGAWRIQGIIFFNLSYLLFKHNIFFSIIFKPLLIFFPFPMVTFFKHPYFFSFWEEEEKQPYIPNNRIFQRSYSFNINSIISSLTSFKSNPMTVSLNKRLKRKRKKEEAYCVIWR